MINKRFIIVISILLAIVLISFFTYKFMENGNTTFNKSEEKIIENILNMNSYKATMAIEIETNKNKTKYVVKQSLTEENKSIQEIIEPSNIAGVITEYDGKNLKISNNKLDLSTTFENYQYVVDNNLWLNSFLKDYKESKNSKYSNQNNEILLEVKNEDRNKYNIYKKLYIDVETGKPIKMIVQDINQKTLVYILYTEIEIS